MLSTPDCTASSTPYWMIGLSTRTSISLGCALVAGRKREPSPAAGKTALRIGPFMAAMVALGYTQWQTADLTMLDPALLRDQPDAVRTGLHNRGLDLGNELDELVALETRRRRLLPEVEGLK